MQHQSRTAGVGVAERPEPAINGASRATPRATSLNGLALAWDRGLRWLAENTFVPSWPPRRWRHPVTGYLLAALLEVGATLLTLLVMASPVFSFPGMLQLFVVALVALSWGAAPSLAATLIGTLLLEVVILPRTHYVGGSHVADAVEIVICLAIGGILSLVASGTERARRRAVRERAAAQASELALRQMGERTDEFLSIASHELRTPLTSIKGALQLAERRVRRLASRPAAEGGAPNVEDAILPLLQMAAHEVDRQNRLVGDLLDVSRIRAGKLEFIFGPCDLVEVVESAVEAQRLAWPGRTITLDLPDGPAPLVGDEHRIGQVVTNYLTNALKYSPPDAPVAASLRLADGVARVAVRDRGPGLTPAQQAHIWDRFHRVPGVKQQSGSGAGLGLGLYICKTIVERHGGRVGVESTPGQGSAFWFTLPLAPRQP